MRRATYLGKLISGEYLRRAKILRPPFHPARALPTPTISSPKPKPHILLDSKSLTYIADRRFYSGGESGPVSDAEVNKAVDEINLKFVEAREEIELAMESKETVYFNEEAEAARDAVKEVLELFEGLLGRVGENERGSLQRSMGMKIEQLKAELEQLNE